MFNDSVVKSFSVNNLATSEFVSVHFAAFSISNKLMLSMYLSDEIISLTRKELSSCFNFRNHLNVDMIFFSKKHSQNAKINSS
jgi:hypothetical protein